MSVVLPNKRNQAKEKRDKFVPLDQSQMRSDLDKHVAKLQKEGEGWWKKISKKKPAAGIGVGCGVGVGFGVTGAAGVDPFFSLHLPLQVAFGVGAGCGAGVGWGVGFGIGRKLEPYSSKKPKAVKRI